VPSQNETPPRWQVRSHILVPLDVRYTDSAGNFLSQIQFNSYIGDEIRYTLSNGFEISFSKDSPNGERKRVELFGTFYEEWILTVTATAPNAQTAVELALPEIEWICDRMSFSLLDPVQIERQETKRVDGDGTVWAIPGGHQPVKFREVSHIGQVRLDRTIDIPERSEFEERDRAALRWYHKALASKFEVDKFIFFWICLEITCKSDGTAIKDTYTAACGHAIKSCPTCGKPTERPLTGKTLQNFLVTSLNVSEENARKLWRFRQMLHGENELTEASTKEMSNLTLILHSAVTLALKRRLRYPEDSGPCVSNNGLLVHSVGIDYTPTK
jgi:hypothetical protein